ncbi:hypothetical protein EU522_00860 [Candidatus Thorarchaeota archaeon]|nr:MAG: hypothetical protein EU522_00860 [Candidatus Thorarchaeota archaeon]
MSAACTIAAKKVGSRYFLLKNRDLTYPDFQDQIIFDPGIFAVKGVHIGAGVDIGVSIGVNRHGLAGCSATVLANEDLPYDILLERILRETKNIGSAYQLIENEIAVGHQYQWCNFVLASPESVAAIEIGERISIIEENPEMITRTNHHLKLGTTERIKAARPEEREAAGSLHTSQARRQTASKMLSSAVTLGDMIEILSNHSKSRGFDSICRHWSSDPSNQFLGETACSYILEVSNDVSSGLDMRFHTCSGNPCSSTYKETVVDFDAKESKDKS